MELGGKKKNEVISAWTSPLCTSLILPICISLFSSYNSHSTFSDVAGCLQETG